MEAEELSLLERARSGESEAFRTLVVRYQRKVYAVALGIVKDRDLAWDVSQEAFVRVHQNLGTFKGDSSFSTWVLRITTHLAIDAVRRERSSSKDDIDEVREADLDGGGEGILATALGTNPQENALRRELMGKMQEALDQLPEKHCYRPEIASLRNRVLRISVIGARETKNPARIASSLNGVSPERSRPV
jgi:RNA polymerase sigma-70 factor (ECF subfamily)